MLEMVRNLVGERIVVNLKLTPAPAMVCADPNQLLQIVTNVVTNAAEAMPEGGKLDIETSSVALGIRDGPLAAGRYAQILIRDTGRGMDEDTRRLLFEPFFTTKGTGKGSGLSLAAAYGMVRHSGGDIRVVSVSGHGTAFRILLPLVEHSQSAAEKPSATAVTDQTGLERRRILIVDDEADIRAFLRSALEPEGYEISEAGDGRQAISIVRASPIDLVVTDLVMPAQEGLETIQQIRQSGHSTRIIAISGAFGGRYLRTADLIGADATLPKPVDPVVLIDTVRSVLSGTHRRR
jgi:CheY-like chemotaxis protein